MHSTLPDQGDLTVKHITLPMLCTVMVFGNGMLIYLVAMNKKLRTVTNYFVTNLALSDLLMGVVVIPLLVAAEEEAFGHSPKTCLTIFCLAISQVFCSCLTLIMVAIERYIAIIKPLHHHMWLTTRNCMALMVFVWIYSCILGFIPLSGWNTLDAIQNSSQHVGCRYQNVIRGSYAAFMYPGHFTPLWILMIVLYGKVYLQSRRTQLSGTYRVHRLTMFIHNGGQNSRRAKENWRALKILIVIVGYFVLSWLPVVVWYSTVFHGFTREYAFDIDPPLPNWFYNVSITLAFGNSAINPFLYGFGNRSVRAAWIKTFVMMKKRCQRKKSTPDMYKTSTKKDENDEIIEEAVPIA